MAAWAIHETRMRVERVRSGSGLEGWTVTWKGRGWDRPFEDYLDLGEGRGRDDARGADAGGALRQVPPPDAGRAVRRGRVPPHHERLAAAWGDGTLLLEKDFSPTLAGDALADERDRILRWLREVPGLIRRSAAPARGARRPEADERPPWRALSGGDDRGRCRRRRAGVLQPPLVGGARRGVWRIRSERSQSAGAPDGACDSTFDIRHSPAPVTSPRAG